MPDLRAGRKCSSSTLYKDASKLVFALLIVKSKPESTSMKAFLLGIRKALFLETATGSPRDSLIHREDNRRYKDAFKENDRIQALLRAQNAELEQENQKLRDQLSLKTIDQTSRQDLQSPINGISINPSELETSAPKIRFVLDELEVSLPSGEVDDHVRNLYSLNAMLSQAKLSNGEVGCILAQLATSSARLLAEIDRTFDTGINAPMFAPRQRRNEKLNAPTIIDNAVRGNLISRTVHRILVGLDRLGENTIEKGLESHIINELLSIFTGILDLLKKLAESSRRTYIQRKPPRKKQKKVQPPWVTYIDKQSTQYNLCELFVLMFASLQMEQATHREIMEGTLRDLLLRMGNILRVFVFDVPFSEQFVGDTSRPSTPSAGGRGSGSNSSMEVEAPYVLWIFEKTMAIWHKKLRSLRSNEEAIKLDDRKIELQNTLLLGVFPNDHRSFIESLREPLAIPGVDIDTGVIMVAKEDIRNYFKQEVNRLLGWDVLSKVIAWD